jgi:hypothetical protein
MKPVHPKGLIKNQLKYAMLLIRDNWTPMVEFKTHDFLLSLKIGECIN